MGAVGHAIVMRPVDLHQQSVRLRNLLLRGRARHPLMPVPKLCLFKLATHMLCMFGTSTLNLQQSLFGMFVTCLLLTRAAATGALTRWGQLVLLLYLRADWHKPCSCVHVSCMAIACTIYLVGRPHLCDCCTSCGATRVSTCCFPVHGQETSTCMQVRCRVGSSA
jgi:hypothetical protein